MAVFKEYSAYYDLLYKDKDYDAECSYIVDLIKQSTSKAKTILNLGCGTGKHDYLLAEKGYIVTGVDLSGEMVEIARNKQRDYSIHNMPSFKQGDIRDLNLKEKFDVVTALFHVICYQTTNGDLKNAFIAASNHLESDGIFIFDCWYGPAVLTDRPHFREKLLENDHFAIKRTSTPVMHPNENCVDVVFGVDILDKRSGEKFVLNEVHKMRYLFFTEIKMLADLTGFKIIINEAWLSRLPLSFSSWNAVFVCRKIKRK